MQQLPCPLSAEQCEALAELETRIPQVIEIVRECEECVVKIPNVAASLSDSLAKVRATRAFLASHFSQPS